MLQDNFSNGFSLLGWTIFDSEAAGPIRQICYDIAAVHGVNGNTTDFQTFEADLGSYVSESVYIGVCHGK